MSIEAKIDELLAALRENTAATTENTGILERAVAGQQIVLEKVEAGTTAGAPTRKRRTKAEMEADAAAEAAAVTDQNVAEEGKELTGANTASEVAAVTTAATDWVQSETDKNLKATAVAFMKQFEKAENREQATKWLQEMIGSFGVDDRPLKMLTGATSLLDDDMKGRCIFFIKRAFKLATEPDKKEPLSGLLKVNFSAPYDFAGDPTQPEPASAGGADAEFDPLG